MKQKLFFIVFSCILAILVFLAFNARDNNQNKSNRDNVVIFQTLQLASFSDYINKVINEFETENPGVKIKWIDVPYAEGEKRTLAAVLSDNPPDLINVTPDFSLMLAKKKALLFIDKNSLTDYVPAVLDLLKYKDEYFGIPFYATSAITLYNKELINDFDFTELPFSYDELFKIKRNVNLTSDEYLTMINFGENDTLVKLLNKYGINTPDTLISQKSHELFEKFKYMYDNELIPKESVTQTHRDALEKYMSKQLLFIVTGGNFLNMIEENAPKIYESTGVLPQLTGSSELFDCSVMNFIIPKKARNKEYALKFALHFTNKANQLEFAKLTGVLPVNTFALEDDYFKQSGADYYSKDVYFSAIVNSSDDVKTKSRKISAYQLNFLQSPFNYTDNKKEVNAIYSQTAQEILINDDNIDEALHKLSSNLSKL